MDTCQPPKKPPTQWRKFLTESHYKKGAPSKIPKKGTDDYNTLMENYNSWKATPSTEAPLTTPINPLEKPKGTDVPQSKKTNKKRDK